MYCILLDSTRLQYIPFLKFLLENKPNSFEVVEYTSIDEINWQNLQKYDYVISLNRFCYINFAKVIEFCSEKQPSFAALSTYWGVGFPYLAILSKDTIGSISSKHEEYKKYFDDKIENLFINILLGILELSEIKDLLSQSDGELQQLYSLHKIEALDHQCYLNSVGYTNGYFHNSIFVSFDDTEDKFVDFLTEYHSGKKYVKYKNKPYRLEIGKQFFVIKNYHIGILDQHTIVFWDRSTSSWKKAGRKLHKKISSYIKKNFALELDFTSDQQ
jgi:hypothetical protein